MGQLRTDIEQPKKDADVLTNPQVDAAKEARPVDAPEIELEDENKDIEEATDDPPRVQ